MAVTVRGVVSSLRSIGPVLGRTGAVTGARLLSQTGGIVLFGLLAHKLGANAVGQYGLVLQVYATFQAFVNAGFDSLLAREAALDDASGNSLLTSGLTIKSIWSVFVYALLVAFLLLMRYSTEVMAASLVIGLALVPDGLAIVLQAMFQAKLQIEYIALALLISSIVRLTLSIGAVLMGSGIVPLAGIFLVGQVINLIVMWSLYLSHLDAVSWRVAWPLVKHLFRESFAFLGITVISLGLLNSDVIILSKLGSETDMGIYVSAYKLMQIGWVPITTFSLVIYPHLVRSEKVSRQEFMQTFTYWGEFLLSGVIGVVILLRELAGPLVHVIFSKNLDTASGVLGILAWALVPLAVDQIVIRAMYTFNLQRFNLIALGAGAVSMVGLSVVLTPFLGPSGPAVALVSSLSLVALLDSAFTLFHIKVPLYRFVWRPIVAGAIMLLVVRILAFAGPFIAILPAALVYVAALVALRVPFLGRPPVPMEWQAGEE